MSKARKKTPPASLIAGIIILVVGVGLIGMLARDIYGGAISKTWPSVSGSVQSSQVHQVTKIIGIILIVVGITCFAFVVSGLFAWTSPAPEDASPASLADTLAARMLFLSLVGAVSTIGGVVALTRGVVKSRGAKLANHE